MKTNLGINVDTIFIKIAVVAVLVAVMLLPISLIESLIEEREQNQSLVQDDISTKWGGKQQITGPILVLPFRSGTVEPNKNPVVQYAYFLPDNLNVDGDLKTEVRKRTLFKTLVYQSDMQIKGQFSLPDFEKLNLKPEWIEWQDAFVLIGISDMKGIKNKIDFMVNGKSQLVEPGIKPNSAIKSGLTVAMPLDPEVGNYDFSFTLALNGSEGIYMTPVGKENQVHLKSEWNTVSFDGDFLPTKRTIDKNGFDATWDVFDYNRNYVQMWIGENDMLKKSTMGVDLKFPVDSYQMTMRSVKYAIMFIVLTFVVFFLVELLSKKRIHPVQYLLVSCALVIFYTLLLAISEHLSFDLSYLISALATTLLITAYSTTMFKSMKQAGMMGLFLAMLYVYLYVILLQESMSLLLGAVGLFIALAIVMFVLRKVNWYKDKEDGFKINKTEEVIITNSTDERPPVYRPKDNDIMS